MRLSPNASRRSTLRLDRLGAVVGHMVTPNQIDIRRQQDVAAHHHPARRKEFAVETDVRAVVEFDVAVLARQNGIASDKHPRANANASIRGALGVQKAVVIDHDVVGNVNLVRMPKHDVLPEDDIAAARAKQPRITGPPEPQAECPGPRLSQGDDRFVFEQVNQA